WRIATSGSTRLARRAGTNAAAKAVATSTAVTTANVIGSVGSTPKRNLLRTRVTPAATANPTTTPARDIAAVRRSTRFTTPTGEAPSAMRIPNSRDRSFTADARTP